MLNIKKDKKSSKSINKEVSGLSGQVKDDDPKQGDTSSSQERELLFHGNQQSSNLERSSKSTGVAKRPRYDIEPSDGRDTDVKLSARRLDVNEGTNDAEELSIAQEELSKMSRSERKRFREKKRRTEVNRGFDDLMNLLIEIDPEVRAEAEERARRGQWKGSMGAQEDNLLSRVDLISRAVNVLRRVHDENEQRKTIIYQLLQESNRRQEESATAASILPQLLAAEARNQYNTGSSTDQRALHPSSGLGFRTYPETERTLQNLTAQRSLARSTVGLDAAAFLNLQNISSLGMTSQSTAAQPLPSQIYPYTNPRLDSSNVASSTQNYAQLLLQEQIRQLREASRNLLSGASSTNARAPFPGPNNSESSSGWGNPHGKKGL